MWQLTLGLGITVAPFTWGRRGLLALVRPRCVARVSRGPAARPSHVGPHPVRVPWWRRAPKEELTLGYVPVVSFSGSALRTTLVVLITLVISILRGCFELFASVYAIITASALPPHLVSSRFLPVPSLASIIGWVGTLNGMANRALSCFALL